MPKKAKILAIDVGTKKIGIAVTDEDRIFAIPKTIVIRKSNVVDFNKLISIMQQNNIYALIVGLPLLPNGAYGDIANFVVRFVNNFCDHYQKTQQKSIDILLFDERLSSFTARLYANKEQCDDIAASLILQNWLVMECDED